MTLAWVRRTDRNLKCQICGEGMAECSDVRWLRSLSARGHHHQQQQPATWPAQSSSFAASTPTLVLATLRTGSNGGQSLCYRCWVWDLVKLTPHFFTFLPATVRWFVLTYLALAAMGQAHHRKFTFQHSPPLCFPRWHDRERIVMARHFLSRVLDDTVVQRLGSTSSLPTTTAGVAILKILTKHPFSRGTYDYDSRERLFSSHTFTHCASAYPRVRTARSTKLLPRSIISYAFIEFRSSRDASAVRHLTTCKWTRIDFPRDRHLFLRKSMGGTLMDPV